MAKQVKKKRSWKVEEEGLNPIQKGIIVALVSFIPFFFFILIPVLARDHFVKKLKIPAEVFLSPPEKINLVKSSETGPTFKVNINGVEFKIPVKFTPIQIGKDFVRFVDEPRRMAKSIYIHSSLEPREINYSATGFARWFMPDTVLEFMQLILRANWHPVRLMFKAQFFAVEGITTRIFEARWDAHHRGFIFPLPGQAGYIGRIFRTNGPGYFEFSIKDDIQPVTLRQWVDLAMKIRPPSEKDEEVDPFAPGFYNLEYLIKQAKDPDRQVDVLSRSLNEFYRTKKSFWLIPVAIVMGERGFNSELIDLHKQFLPDFAIDSPLKETWNSILDTIVEDTLKIEVDTKLRQKELNVFCKNLTDKQINQILIRIQVKYKKGNEKSFIARLLKNERLFEHQEKKLLITVPPDISLIDYESLSYRIMQIDFID